MGPVVRLRVRHGYSREVHTELRLVLEEGREGGSRPIAGRAVGEWYKDIMGWDVQRRTAAWEPEDEEGGEQSVEGERGDGEEGANGDRAHAIAATRRECRRRMPYRRPGARRGTQCEATGDTQVERQGGGTEGETSAGSTSAGSGGTGAEGRDKEKGGRN